MSGFSVDINGVSLTFETRPGLFSPGKADRGTRAMLSAADEYFARRARLGAEGYADYAGAVFTAAPAPRFLDLGCGYGLAGIYLSKKYPGAFVHMCDIDPAAVAYAGENAGRNHAQSVDGGPGAAAFISDGFNAIPPCGRKSGGDTAPDGMAGQSAYAVSNDSGYTAILCNPPYHSDFSVAKRFIEQGFNRLALGGVLFFVTKRREWYKNKFIAIFGGVNIVERDGYFVFAGEKRGRRYGRRKRAR